MKIARLCKRLGFLSVLGLAFFMVACTGVDTEPFTTTGSVIVAISPDDASVSLEALSGPRSTLSTQQLAPQQTGASLHYLKPPGDYKLTVSRDGYETQTRTFSLQASEVRYFTIALLEDGGPGPGPGPDPVELTLAGTVANWDAENGEHLTFGNAIIDEFDGELEVFFFEPVFSTTISERGAFEVTLTEPAEEDLFPDEFCSTEVNTAYVTIAGVSTEPYPNLGTVSGIIVQASIQDLFEPRVGDAVVGAIYFDQDVQAKCDDFGLRIDIDAKKGWNTVVQTITAVDGEGLIDIEFATKLAPPEAQWTFFPIEDLIGPGELSVMNLRSSKR